MESRIGRLHSYLRLLKETQRAHPGFLNRDIENCVDALLLEIRLRNKPSLYKVSLLCESIKAYGRKDPFLDFAYLILKLYRDRTDEDPGAQNLPPTRTS